MKSKVSHGYRRVVYRERLQVGRGKGIAKLHHNKYLNGT